MISYFYPPMGGGGVFRCLKLSRYLPGFNWEPVVLCGRPEDYWVRDESLLSLVPENLQVHRVGGLTGLSILRRIRRSGLPCGTTRSSACFRFLRALSNFLVLPDSYAGWIDPALSVGRQLLKEGSFDLIFSSGPPDSTHLVGLRLARESGLPWVADFRDPWFNLHMRKPPTVLHRILHQRMEAKVLAQAEPVTVTEGWQHLLQCRRGLPVHLIRNCFDPSDFENLRPQKGEDGLFFVHTGTLSLDRSSITFLKGLASLLKLRPDLRSTLRIDFLGPRESENDKALRETGLSDIVRFREPVSHREALSLQCSADLLLLLQQSDPRYVDLVPGKLYEYMGAGRPIFAVGQGREVSSLLEKHGLGWMSKPDPEAVAATLDKAINQIRTGWKRAEGELSQYQCSHQAAQMAEVFDSLVMGRN